MITYQKSLTLHIRFIFFQTPQQCYTVLCKLSEEYYLTATPPCRFNGADGACKKTLYTDESTCFSRMCLLTHWMQPDCLGYEYGCDGYQHHKKLGTGCHSKADVDRKIPGLTSSLVQMCFCDFDMCDIDFIASTTAAEDTTEYSGGRTNEVRIIQTSVILGLCAGPTSWM